MATLDELARAADAVLFREGALTIGRCDPATILALVAAVPDRPFLLVGLKASGYGYEHGCYACYTTKPDHADDCAWLLARAAIRGER